MTPPSGILNLDKPPGLSSARAVATVKRLLPKGTKVGHAGTLDPFATGVLLILVGKATKLCEPLMGSPKSYDATLKLGATTATLDPESDELPHPNPAQPSAPQVETTIPQFVGTIQQTPPIFSAMKIAGRRAYDLARKGHDVQLQPRPVRIDRIDILSYHYPELRLHIDCGRGTYIRSLARDLGEALGSAAYLTALRRTRVGPFTTDDAISLDSLPTRDLVSCLRDMTP